MDIEHALSFVRANHHAVLATLRRDGRPQLSPVTCGVDDDGDIVISSRETAVKTINLRREPHASVCVLSDGFYGDWIQIDGSAEVIGLPQAMDALVAYYRSIAGEHPDWDDYRNAMTRERRVIVRITPERAGPDHSG